MSSIAHHRLIGLVTLLAALTAACQPNVREPRRLVFPVFQAEAPFPESETAEGAAGSKVSATSQFARDLGGAPAVEASVEPEGFNVPLGSTMTARLPHREGWTWSIEDGATLISYAPASGRPGAIVYVEPFAAEIHDRPSAEHLRFQATVDPDLADGFLRTRSAVAVLAGKPRASTAGLNSLEAAMWDQLRRTRTRGRGLGFRPNRSTFTGWKWVGRNPQGVTVRCGRYLGVWAGPRPLPAQIARPAVPPASESSASEISAYLLLGSATDRDEETGVHFALLCVREPRCLVYRELSEFLKSIQIAESTLLGRLRSEPPASFRDLVQQTGLDIEP